MIPSILVLLAAAADPPKKLKPLYRGDDYPASAWRKGEQGEVVADLLINPAGGVDTCDIALSSGFRELDDATCSILLNRAHFTPAKDEARNARYDMVRTPAITWSLGSFRSFPVPPDYDLTLNREPDGTHLPVDFALNYFVTRDGKAQDCALSPGKPAAAELVALACQTVTSAPPHIIRNRAGLPVETGRIGTFRFSVDKSPSK